METQGTAKKTIKDWRKQGLGWVPDYPDARDYLLDSEEVQKSSNPRSNSGNLRRNEVTKSIEDIAENLLQVLESLEEGFPRQEKLKKIKTKLKQQVFGEFKFVKLDLRRHTICSVDTTTIAPRLTSESDRRLLSDQL
jgi:hypothetical protein